MKRLKKHYKENKNFPSKIESLFRKLKKLSVNDILDEGLHEFLTTFIKDISAVYSDLEKKYFSGA